MNENKSKEGMKKLTFVMLLLVVAGLLSFVFFFGYLPTHSDEPTGRATKNTPSESVQDRNVRTQKTGMEELDRYLEERNLNQYDMPDTELYEKFEWEFRGKEFTVDLKAFVWTIDFYKWRERNRPLEEYVNDEYEFFVPIIVEKIEKQGRLKGIPDSQVPYLAVSFVQNLPYTSDDISTGHDEYPRFPFETLMEEGGDCEDSSILVASIFKEMGYGVVLLRFPGHVAVGVMCGDGKHPFYEQTYYEYNGKKYCYLETTQEGWMIGEIPEKYKGVSASIVSV